MPDGKPPSNPYRPPEAQLPSGTPEEEGPVMTEGMLAHRREIDRKKREWKREQEFLREESSEGWTRVWKTVAVVLVVIGLAYLYWRMQSAYQDRWPMGYVWLVMVVALGAGITWLLWFTSKSDL